MYGVKRSGLLSRITLVEDYPSKIAKMLLNDEIDIGLLPVAILPQLKEFHFVTDYCIGTEGEVASVGLFSEVPLEKIETVLLDYQSRTSINLAKMLFKWYWKISPKFENATLDFRKHIQGTTAGIVIGDRALEQLAISKYVYDLGSAWKLYTNLPFVFAAWVANKKLDEGFIEAFNMANAYGVQHIDEVLETVSSDLYDLKKYYTKNLSYTFTSNKKEGLQVFLEKLKEL